MSISSIKRGARASLNGYWGTGVALTLLVFLINMILPMIVEVPLSGGFALWISTTADPPLLANVASTVISIILIPLAIAVTWFYLELVRNGSPKLEQVFTIYKDIKKALKLIGASILQGIFVFLWALLFIIPGIIKGLAYSQTFYLLKDDPDLTVIEAITESRKRMVGLKGKLFLFHLSFIGWALLCLLTIGIGFLWLTPYYSASIANFYKELIADKNSKIDVF